MCALYIFLVMNTPVGCSDSPAYIYCAAALFNCRELLCNISLNEILESEYGYKCYIPQRDGFEGQIQFIRSLLKEEYKQLNDTNNTAELADEELTTCIRYLIYIYIGSGISYTRCSRCLETYR